jgi:hypothetical protein
VSERKVSRKEQRRQQVKQQRRKRILTIALPLAIVILGLGGLLIARAIGIEIAGVTNFGAQEQGHDEGVVFEDGDLPLTGGVHSPRWQTCGIYDQPVETKNAVHSMEHGAVWIAYQPELPISDVTVLQELVRGRSYLLLSPYPSLRSEVVLSAWGVQLEVESVTDERIAGFIDQYRLGPQTPEFGATCDGGVGTPIG